MAENIVIKGKTYTGTEAVDLLNENGETVFFYPDAVRYNKQTLTEEQKAQARENIGAANVGTNCKIIAHRGYHANVPQNTIASFIAAVNNGFKWLEIDIRQCADGIYILAHDATYTLYNNGVAVSVTFATSNYADIKNYTWDMAGQYKINTLLSAFNALKVYDVQLVLDRKTGSNEELMRLASLAGVTDKVMLSYTSPNVAINEASLLAKYDNVPIRVIPSDWTTMNNLKNTITNPLYCDVNADEITFKQKYLPIALATGTPIVFSGCTVSNAVIWQVLANGCMAHDNLNISWQEFVELLAVDYTQPCTITSSVGEITVTEGAITTISASSDCDNPSGYIYGYSNNPAAVSLSQTAFGKSATFELTGVAKGSTSVCLFTGSGAMVNIAVTVKGAESDPVIADVKYYNGASSSGGTASPGYRAMAYQTEGTVPYSANASISVTMYPIAIPAGKTKVTIVSPGLIYGVQILKVDTKHNQLADPGWAVENGGTYDFSAYAENATHISINFKNSANGPIATDFDFSGFSITFS